jgi:hypothetical protein
MHPDTRKSLCIPVMITLVGIGWLLTAKGVGEEINWVWTLCLGGIGILTFVVSGANKCSVVVGTFFLLASGVSLLRQTHRIGVEVEVPVLVICIGALLILAHLPLIPAPSWWQPTDRHPSE